VILSATTMPHGQEPVRQHVGSGLGFGSTCLIQATIRSVGMLHLADLISPATAHCPRLLWLTRRYDAAMTPL